jgi:hypothetical protein
VRTYQAAFLAALLCSSSAVSVAQKEQRPLRTRQTPVPSQRVALKPLPPPPPDSHGHGPETHGGTPPCGYARLASYSPNCGNAPAPKQTTPSRTQQPSPVVNRGGSGPGWGLGLGVGAVAGVTIWSLSEHSANQVREQLSRSGPQFPDSLRMSDFQVTGFAKGGWPVVVDYEAEPGTYLLLTVVTQNAAPAQAVLAVPPTGRRMQLLRLPVEFGTTLKSAAFSLTATTSATDPTPRYVRVYGFGCGPKAVGSVAIDQLRFGPVAISASQPDTHFGFHAHTTFDKMTAEFMQIAMVDHSIEGQLFDNKKIDRRVAEGERVNDQWSAKKAKTGQIQFRVRGWMTVHSDEDGGDWVSAFSPDLVFKQ